MDGERVRQALETVDRRDTDGFLAHLQPGVRFRFGNAPVIEGTEALRPVLQGFFGALAGLRHEVEDLWVDGADVVCHGWVTYIRLDQTSLRVPFALVLRFEEGLIRDYLIFVDNSELFPNGD